LITVDVFIGRMYVRTGGCVYTPTWKPWERKQRTSQEHINILWTYPVADRMIYYKKRKPVHTYILPINTSRVISYNTITMTIVIASKL